MPRLRRYVKFPILDSCISQSLLFCGLDIFRGNFRLREHESLLHILPKRVEQVGVSNRANRTCLPAGVSEGLWPPVAHVPADVDLFGVGGPGYDLCRRLGMMGLVESDDILDIEIQDMWELRKRFA